MFCLIVHIAASQCCVRNSLIHIICALTEQSFRCMRMLIFTVLISHWVYLLTLGAQCNRRCVSVCVGIKSTAHSHIRTEPEFIRGSMFSSLFFSLSTRAQEMLRMLCKRNAIMIPSLSCSSQLESYSFSYIA